MGPYCNFCIRRCFLLRVLDDGRTVLLATCARGMEHDRSVTGQDHTTARNPHEPLPDRSAVTEPRPYDPMYEVTTPDGGSISVYAQTEKDPPQLVYLDPAGPNAGMFLPAGPDALPLAQAVATAAGLGAVGVLQELHDLVDAVDTIHGARPDGLAHGAGPRDICAHTLCVQASRVNGILDRIEAAQPVDTNLTPRAWDRVMHRATLENEVWHRRSGVIVNVGTEIDPDAGEPLAEVYDPSTSDTGSWWAPLSRLRVTHRPRYLPVPDPDRLRW